MKDILGMKVDADAPNQTRFPAQFRNWSKPGLVISPDKLKTDIDNFRAAARLLATITTGHDARDAIAAAGGLENLAGQWEKIAEAQSDG